VAYEIKWTPISKDNYHEIVSYLYDELGLNAAEKFTKELQDRLKKLERFPYIGKQH